MFVILEQSPQLACEEKYTAYVCLSNSRTVFSPPEDLAVSYVPGQLVVTVGITSARLNSWFAFRSARFCINN